MAKYPIDGLPVDLHFPEDVRPEDWRGYHLFVDEEAEENDEDIETPEDVLDILGYDPDDEDWEDDDEEEKDN